MSPKVPIVDCGPFCAVGFSRAIDKSEFSHSLDPKRTFTPIVIRVFFYGLNEPVEKAPIQKTPKFAGYVYSSATAIVEYSAF